MFAQADTDLDDVAQSTVNLTLTLVWAAGALVVAFVLTTIVSVIVRRVARRRPLLRDMAVRLRRPLRAVLMIVAVWVAFRLTASDDEAWFAAVQHGLLIATIVAAAWLVGAAAFVVEDRTLARVSGATDDRHARRVRTQVSVVRRVTVAVIVLCAIAAVLLTFPAMRAAGASLLASAGLLSIVAGLAAQSSLANAFAGMQIAFTDAIRVDDVVVLNGEFGRIEEITLTYVVVHAWDDRRLILPCTYFTTTPFENWTRRDADLLGTVELDVDFAVPFTAMRAELDRLLDSTPLWDRRTGVLQVTDAVGGQVRARALVSAGDAPTLWDLRCYVREGLVEWLQRSAPGALPRTRLERAAAAPAIEAAVDGDAAAGSVASAASAASATSAARAAAPAVIPADRGRSASSAASAASAAEPREVGRREKRSEKERDQPGGSRVPRRADAPDGAPRRPSVRGRDLPPPTRSTVPPATDDPATVVRRGSRRDRSAEETIVLSGPERSALFSGSAWAEERSKHFHGPGQDVIDEREQSAVRRLTGDDRVEPDDEARRRLPPDPGDGGPAEGSDGDGGEGGDGQ